MSEYVEKIVTQLKEAGVPESKINQAEIEKSFNVMVKNFRVPEQEAFRGVLNSFLKKNGLSPAKTIIKNSVLVKISDIKKPEEWVDLKVKVMEIWDSTSDTISQAGLIGDETGVIKFIKWTKSALPDMEVGKNYLIKNVISDVYKGNFSIKMNKTSVIEEITEEIDAKEVVADFIGAVVDIQKGSGLIKRCPVCKKSLDKGACKEHGKVEGVYDLRIKAVLDNGNEIQEIILNKEMTEKVTGITMDQAKIMAMEALDGAIVGQSFKNMLIGEYILASGRKVDRYILAEIFEKLPALSVDEIQTALAGVA
jgi:replication factor A1